LVFNLKSKTLDKFRVIIFLILFLLLGCSKPKPFNALSPNDSTLIFMQKAENIKLPYKLRLAYTKNAVAFLIKEKNDSLNSSNLLRMAHNFYLLNSWEDLKEISHSVLEKSKQKKDAYFIGHAYKLLGTYYLNISYNDSAYYYFLKSEKKFVELNAQREICDIYIQKALLKYYINDYLGSQASCINALKIAKRHSYILNEYDCYMYLQLNLFELHDYKSAIEYCNKSILLVKNNPSIFKPQDLAFSLKAIGNNYYKWGKNKEAIKYYERALLKKNLAICYKTFYCNLIDNYGEALLNSGKIKNVEKLLFFSNRIRDSLHINQCKNYNRLYISQYYQATKQLEKAKQFAQEAYNLSKSYRNAGDILLSLKQLAKVDTMNALKYSQEYIRISDSMQHLERITRNKFAKIAYETEEITNEKEQAIKQKWIFLNITVVLWLVGILLFIIILQRNKQKEMRLLQDQQKANEEIYQLIQNQQTKIDEGRQIEKKRIAQDLHDGIMNRLASTRLNLHVIAEKPSVESLKKCLPFIDGIQDIEKEIRNIAHDLNSNAFANKTSFIAVVELFIEEQKSISNSKYHLEIDTSINWEQIEGYKKIHLFRILQESIQNIEKHAKAKNIIVSILKVENQLLIEIFDDGNGFTLKRKKKGIGLQNIFSRAKCCNGSADIKSKINEGTTVIVKIPI
jgi:signal transduction histidine kinase